MGSKVKNRPIINGIQHKQCTKCGEIKPLEAYGNDRKGLFGKFAKCKSCVKNISKSNKSKKAKYDFEYRRKNIEKYKEYEKMRSIRDRNKRNKLRKKWASKNLSRRREISLNWAKRNKDYMRYSSMLRYTMKMKATPKWVDLGEIKKIYKNCPKGYHVDHIIPLKNPIVCGLHVPWNLQYLSARENLRKSNRLTV